MKHFMVGYRQKLAKQCVGINSRIASYLQSSADPNEARILQRQLNVLLASVRATNTRPRKRKKLTKAIAANVLEESEPSVVHEGPEAMEVSEDDVESTNEEAPITDTSAATSPSSTPSPNAASPSTDQPNLSVMDRTDIQDSFASSTALDDSHGNLEQEEDDAGVRNTTQVNILPTFVNDKLLSLIVHKPNNEAY